MNKNPVTKTLCGYLVTLCAVLCLLGCSTTRQGDQTARHTAALKDDQSGVRSAWAKALKDSDWMVRSARAKALGESKDARAIEPLLAALKDDNSLVRLAAAEALGRFNYQPASEAERISLLIAARKWKELVKLGAPAVEPLLATLKDSDSYVRQGAAKALGDIKDPRAVEPLQQAVQDTDSLAREAAANALGQLNHQPVTQAESITLLIAARKWKEAAKIGALAVEPLLAAARVRFEDQAADALGEIKDARALEPLMAALKDEAWRVRRGAAKALGEIKDPQAVDPLLAAVKDNDSSVRKAAAKALGEIKDPRAVDPLRAAVKDNDSSVRGAAANSLGQLNYQPATQEERISLLIAAWKWEEVAEIGAPAVGPLLAAGKDWDVRKGVAKALGEIKDPRAVELLLVGLKDSDSDMRGAVAKALGEIKDARAVEPLVAALPDWNAKAAIGTALVQLGWQPRTEPEQIYLWICQKDTQQLMRNWEQTRRILLEDVLSSNERRIDNAVFTFVSLGQQGVVEELVRILDRSGHKGMAETYLNCGHSRLAEAARAWATLHGYNIKSGSGSSEASWGRWR